MADASQWFTEKYRDGVTHVYQDKGYRLRDTVSSTDETDAKSAYFMLAKTGTAVQMPPTGTIQDLVPMNAGRTRVKVDFVNYQAAEYIREDDLEKMSVQAVGEAQRTAGMALGRKHDEVIHAAMAAGTYTGTNTVGSATAVWDLGLALGAIRIMQQQDVPWDGQVYCMLPSTMWNQMMTFTQFNNADWVGDNNLSFMQGSVSKFWNGVHWFLGPEGIFTANGANGLEFYMWHKPAVLSVDNKKVQSRITWENAKTAWLANNWMGIASKIRQAEGLVKCIADNSVAIA